MVEHPKKAILFDSHMEKEKKNMERSHGFMWWLDLTRSSVDTKGFSSVFFSPFYGDFNIHRQAMEIFIPHTQNYTTRFGFSNWFTKPKLCAGSERWNTFFLFDWMCNTVRMMILGIIQWVLYWSNLHLFHWHTTQTHIYRHRLYRLINFIGKHLENLFHISDLICNITKSTLWTCSGSPPISAYTINASCYYT